MRAPLLALFLATAATFTHAQSWPTKPVSLIVPYAAGGNVDAVARWIEGDLGRRLGQPIVIENIAGAGGVIGTDRAARAKPDGYTLLLSVESTIIAAKLVSPGIVKYDGLKDFQPITLLGTSPLVLVGRPGLKPDTLAELLPLLRSQPGKFTYATSGIGTSLHIAGEMINLRGGVKMTHVPYRVGAQIVTELMGNVVDLAVLPVPLVAEQVKAGKIKAYGITEKERSPALPSVPSLSENGALEGVDLSVWFGVFAPAGTDPAIVARVNREMGEVLKQPEVREKFATFGLRPAGLGPDAFARFLAQESEKFTEVVRAANIKAE